MEESGEVHVVPGFGDEAGYDCCEMVATEQSARVADLFEAAKPRASPVWVRWQVQRTAALNQRFMRVRLDRRKVAWGLGGDSIRWGVCEGFV